MKLCRVVQAAHQNAMPFIQLIGDQPVYALIIEIKNEHPEQFELILLFLGTFHTKMSFMSAINKRFKGSGLAELLVAADEIAKGSVEQALKGKHYKRGVRCLKLVYELLTRKIIQNGFENGLSISPDLQAKLQVLRTLGENTKDELCDAYRSLQANPEISRFVEAAFSMVEQTESSMTTYWLSFTEMVEALLLNIHALRTQDWDAFKCSLRMMLPWLQIYDNNKYGRWLTEFWLEISSLPEDKAQYM